MSELLFTILLICFGLFSGICQIIVIFACFGVALRSKAKRDNPEDFSRARIVVLVRVMIALFVAGVFFLALMAGAGRAMQEVRQWEGKKYLFFIGLLVGALVCQRFLDRRS